MNRKISIGIQLKADGSGLVGEVRRADHEIVKLGKSAKHAGRGAQKLEKESARLERRMKTTASVTGFLSHKVVALASAYGIFTSLRSVVTTFASFEQGLLNVASVASATTDEMKRLKTAALDAAISTRFDPAATTDALYSLASAGQSVNEQITSLMPVLNFATAVQANLGQASELVSGTLMTFSLAADQAGRVADVFTAAVGASRLNAQRLEMAMRNAAPTAAAYSQRLEGTVAALGILTNSFGTGERAGSGFAAVFRELNANAGKLGIVLNNSNGKMLPFIEVLRRMKE